MKYSFARLGFLVIIAAPLAAFGQVVEIHTAPPGHPQAETRGTAPSATLVWTAGFWHWGHQRYDWVPGSWQRPSRVGWHWVAPRWRLNGNAWHFIEGQWVSPVIPTPRPANRAVVIRTVPAHTGHATEPLGVPAVIDLGLNADSDTAPPTDMSEVQSASPGTDFVWTHGYWIRNNGQFVWVFGSWKRPEHTGFVWTNSAWSPVGNRWRFVAGSWHRAT